MRTTETEIRELRTAAADITQRGTINRDQRKSNDDAISNMNSQEGQQATRLARLSPDTAKAWKWVQENQQLFSMEIFGPPLITCSVKNPDYLNQIESLFQKTNFCAITVQCKADYSNYKTTCTAVICDCLTYI
jgi:hypothetical protein